MTKFLPPVLFQERGPRQSSFGGALFPQLAQAGPQTLAPSIRTAHSVLGSDAVRPPEVGWEGEDGGHIRIRPPPPDGVKVTVKQKT